MRAKAASTPWRPSLRRVRSVVPSAHFLFPTIVAQRGQSRLCAVIASWMAWSSD